MQNPQQNQWLFNARRLPGRVDTRETAALLGFQDHDIPVLVAGKLLTPLGKPALNSPKYFAAVDVEAATKNAEWLSKATRVLSNYWKQRNGRKTEAASTY
jgi:hypothetical protein